MKEIRYVPKQCMHQWFEVPSVGDGIDVFVVCANCGSKRRLSVMGLIEYDKEKEAWVTKEG